MRSREEIRAANLETDNELDSLMGRATQLLDFLEIEEIAVMFVEQGHDVGKVYLAIKAAAILVAARR